MGPERGEIWLVDLGHPAGHETGFERPALVVSVGRFNAFGLVTVCPVTSTRLGYPSHVEMEPADSGLDETSYVEWSSRARSARAGCRAGTADLVVMSHVDRILRLLLGL